MEAGEIVYEGASIGEAPRLIGQLATSLNACCEDHTVQAGMAHLSLRLIRGRMRGPLATPGQPGHNHQPRRTPPPPINKKEAFDNNSREWRRVKDRLRSSGQRAPPVP
jgi:hypothetical protein